MDEEPQTIILSLETAVRGGSISVIRSGMELASACGETGISRAEDLITTIDRILRSVQVELSDIDIIAVSKGPGSYTGIRIGLSTAMGIVDSFGSQLVAVDLFVAMSEILGDAAGGVSAVPIGRDEVAWQQFEIVENVEFELKPQIGNLFEFTAWILGSNCKRAILHSSLVQSLNQMDLELPGTIEMVDAGENLAKYIGLAAKTDGDASDLKPIYLVNHARSRGLF